MNGTKVGFPALRTAYNRLLWKYITTAALSMVLSAALSFTFLSVGQTVIPWLIASSVGLVLAIVEYAMEMAFYKKGKRILALLPIFSLASLAVFGLILMAGRQEAHLMFPFLFGFTVARPLLPALSLLRDHKRLSDENPCESVGRMRSDVHRKSAGVSKLAYLLFEDELTHETHLLLMGGVSAERRYRVIYLPHSGLAVGEVVPDGVSFDPFGNPIEDPFASAVEANSEAAAETPAETAADESAAAGSDATDYVRDCVRDSDAAEDEPPRRSAPSPELDPNSPERQKAARYALAAKVCKAIFFVGIALVVIMGVVLPEIEAGFAPLAFVGILLVFACSLLGDHCKRKDLEIRCTKRTTARCIYTVRRKTGKHSSTRRPVVEYEVDGELYTVELRVSCHRDAEGELYTICYDPLDPGTARAA